MNDRHGKKTIAELGDLSRKGRLHLNPQFQRKSIWGDQERFGLIDSVYRNYPVPEVFLWNRGTATVEEYAVIDGQQRLRAMLDFVNGKGIDKRNNPKFKIKPIKGQMVFDDVWKKNVKKGIGYTDLEKYQQEKIDEYEVHVRIIESDDLEEVEDLFHRLNTNVDPVNRQELRNLIHGDMQKLAQDVGKEIRDYLSLNGLSTHTQKGLLRQADIDSISNEMLLCAVRGEITSSDAKAKDDLYRDNIKFGAKTQVKNKILKIHNDIKKLYPGDALKSTMFTKHNNYLALFTTLYLGLIGRVDNGGEYVKFTIPSKSKERKKLAIRIRKFSTAVVNFLETLGNDAKKKGEMKTKEQEKMIKAQKAYFKIHKAEIQEFAIASTQAHTPDKRIRLAKHKALIDIMWDDLQHQSSEPPPSSADRKWLFNNWQDRTSDDKPICVTCMKEISSLDELDCGHREMKWLGGDNERPNYIPQHKPCNRSDNQPSQQSTKRRRKAR